MLTYINSVSVSGSLLNVFLSKTTEVILCKSSLKALCFAFIKLSSIKHFKSIGGMRKQTTLQEFASPERRRCVSAHTTTHA